jgi:hypothetical protein
MCFGLRVYLCGKGDGAGNVRTNVYLVALQGCCGTQGKEGESVVINIFDAVKLAFVCGLRWLWLAAYEGET